MRKIFVGNLNYQTTEDVLRSTFSEFGNVTYVRVVTDRETGRSRGFGFVEFSQASEASAALANWNSREIDGRSVNVNVANERNQSPGGGHSPRHGAPVQPEIRRNDRRGGRRDQYYDD